MQVGDDEIAVVQLQLERRATLPQTKAEFCARHLSLDDAAAVTSLPEGLQKQPRLTEPEGVLQGRTTRGSTGYTGPRPPVGEAAHHYHFQVFALDTVLAVPFGSDRDQLLNAIKSHVLAKGEVVGRYAQEKAPLK